MMIDIKKWEAVIIVLERDHSEKICGMSKISLLVGFPRIFKMW